MRHTLCARRGPLMSSRQRAPFHQPGALLSPAQERLWLCTDAHQQAASALPREEGTTPRGPLPAHTPVSPTSLTSDSSSGPPVLLRCSDARGAGRASLSIRGSLSPLKGRGLGEGAQDPHSGPLQGWLTFEGLFVTISEGVGAGQ